MGPRTEPASALSARHQTSAALRAPIPGSRKPVHLSTLFCAVSPFQSTPGLEGRAAPGPLSYLRLCRGRFCDGTRPLTATVLNS